MKTWGFSTGIWRRWSKRMRRGPSILFRRNNAAPFLNSPKQSILRLNSFIPVPAPANWPPNGWFRLKFFKNRWRATWVTICATS